LRVEAAPAWLWVAELGAPGTRVGLEDDDAHYLARVVRARRGEIVTVTDGAGGVGRARVVELSPRVWLELESREQRARHREAVVLCGAPEGSRADWLVEKLAEFGVARFQPLDCERDAWPAGSGRAARWRRLATAALRQSQRAHRMEISEPRSLEGSLADLPRREPIWLADPAGVMASREQPPAVGVAIGLIGPAAGFTEAEVAFIQTLGVRAIALADGRLRTETAAMAWAAWWAGAGS
jgi:16S rRNA (uracil1498-N3)-methyltransferase